MKDDNARSPKKAPDRRTVIIGGLAAGLAASPGFAAGDPAPLASIPYRLDYQGWMTVDVTINGRGPYQFIIDTGATLTIAFRNLALLEGFAPAEGPPRRVFGLAGSERLPTIRMGEIAVGPLALREHVGVAIEDWAPPRRTPHGVLGLDFLTRYTLVFDPEAGRLDFYAPERPPLERMRRWRSARLIENTYRQRPANTDPDADPATAGGVDARLYTVRARVNDGRTTFILDLGAGGTFINNAVLNSIEPGAGPSVHRVVGGGSRISGRVSDVFDEVRRVGGLRVASITAGRILWPRPALFVYDAPIFAELGVGGRPYGLLGADLFSDRPFAIDFKGRRVYRAPSD